jgi:lambda family phage portal protein
MWNGLSGPFDTTTLTRVPAEEMMHVYRPSRPGQLRGVTSQAGTVQTISQLDDFDEATLERQKLAAAFTGFIQRPAPLESGIDPITGEAIDETVQESEVKPGSIYTLTSGETVEFPDLPDLGAAYPDFVKHHCRKVAAGTGVPYELLTGDYSDTNDRTVRVALGVSRRKLEQDQWHQIIHQMCQPVWETFLQVMILNGMVTTAMYKVRVTWNPQAWPYINPLQDVQTSMKAVDSGLSSRTREIMKRGDDPDQVDAERKADQDRAVRLRLI